MLINGFNMECLVDWAEEEKIQRQKKIETELEEQKNRRELRLKTESLICKIFNHEELIEVQKYKEGIAVYIEQNAKFYLISNEGSLSDFIKLYYKTLKKENLLISSLVYMQSLSRTEKNIVVDEIEQRYNISKGTLISYATQECIKKYGVSDDEDLINEIVLDTINKIKNSNLENKSIKDKDEGIIDSYLINEAVKTIIYINEKTNLKLNPYLRCKKKVLTKRK